MGLTLRRRTEAPENHRRLEWVSHLLRRVAVENLPTVEICEPHALASGASRIDVSSNGPDASAYGSGKISTAARLKQSRANVLTKTRCDATSAKGKLFLVHCCILSLLPFLVIGSQTVAAESANLIKSVELGFQGIHKIGHWVPIQIEVERFADLDKCQLDVVVPDGDGVTSVFSVPVADTDFLSGVVSSYVRIGRMEHDLTIRFVFNNDIKASRTFSANELTRALPSQEILVLTLGSDLALEPILQGRKSSLKTNHVAVKELSQFPNHWIGYSSIDLLIIPTLNNDLIGRLSKSQLHAIVEYVRRGGEVILSAGQNAMDTIGEQKPFRDLLPGDLKQVVAERQTTAIEDYVGGANQRLDLAIETAESFSMPMALVSNVNGKVILEEGIGSDKKPIIMSGAIGFGRVIFVAFDLDSNLISNWNDRAMLMNKLLDIVFGQVGYDEPQDSSGEMTRSGYNDLVGQLRASLEIFAGARLTPFSIVASLVVVYLLVIGPLDYFLLLKLNRRFVWTWLTFPVLVFSFCGLAYGLAEFSKSKQILLNRFSIVDVDLKDHQAFGTSWFHLYTPSASTFNLSVDPLIHGTKAKRDVVLNWQGLPGPGFGGMGAGLSTSLSDNYSIYLKRTASDLETTMERLPINGNTSRSLVSRWSVDLEPDSYQNHSLLQIDGENQLKGLVFNPLEVELRDNLLLFDRWVYSIGSLGPGQSKSLASIRPLDVKTILTRQEFVKNQYRMTPWDREDSDMHRIGRMMMFYASVRGRTYTKLLHRYQNYLDSSKLLQQNRALLVGRANANPDRLLRDGKPIQTDDKDAAVFYRVSFPVGRSAGF